MKKNLFFPYLLRYLNDCLKRIAAIFFFAVLLFNIYGYRMLIDCMENKQSAIAQSKIDNEAYNDAELISVKTALNLPYYTNSETFEKVHGSADVNGVVYNYVKRRVYHDTLELLCLPDKSVAHLQSVKNDFLKLSIEGTPSQQNQKAPGVIKILLPDYCQEFALFSLKAIAHPVTKYFISDVNPLPAGFSLKAERPPDAMHTTLI